MKTKYWDFPRNNLAIEIKNLNKAYNDKTKNLALDNISLEIPAGSFFGLLGPNGAGKSTLINIVSGVVIKTSGDVSIWGYDIDKQRKQSKLAIGVVPQELNIDAFFTPNEMLNLHSGMFSVPKSSWISRVLLDLMDLTDKASTYSRKLSGGMRRRLLVAKAMVHSPPIIILDEPTAGVDVELRQKLWKNFIRLNKQGVTIILTTHYLEEAQYLCDHIAIINKGKIIANEKKESLLTKFNKKTHPQTYRYGVLTLYITLALLFQLVLLYITRTTHNFSRIRKEVRNNAKIAEGFSLSKLKSKFMRK